MKIMNFVLLNEKKNVPTVKENFLMLRYYYLLCKNKGETM